MSIIAGKDILNDLIFSSLEKAAFLNNLPGDLTGITPLLKKALPWQLGLCWIQISVNLKSLQI